MNWEQFETECVNHLNSRYSSESGCEFIQAGGHNSHESDILVYKDNNRLFSIEAKMAGAQSGQFVLFPDAIHRRFVYSERNEFGINEFSARIIAEMEKRFEDYSTPSSKPLAFDKELFYCWVKNHYKIERGAEFIISKMDEQFVILSVDKFEKYFDISAVFRTKKSGSVNPNSYDIASVTSYLDAQGIAYSNLSYSGGHILIVIPGCEGGTWTITSGRYSYFFRRVHDQTYRITRLSNTYNANVIFTIGLVRDQDPEDLEEFLYRIGYYD